MKTYSRVLSIAGSDSGGGAGIQADIKAISATGSYAATAITAVTVQNTLGVSAVHCIPADIVAAQIDAVLSDIGADAVKTGMLGETETVVSVADALRRHDVRNLVVDPVMVATSGDTLLQNSAVAALKEELLPLASIITPNIPEAEVLSGCRVTSAKDLPELARTLSVQYSVLPGRKVSVLMKAGHIDEDTLTDWFYNAESGCMLELSSPRTDTPNTHGTGCSLSSALASFLAQGFSPDDAARLAKQYISAAIASGARYETGHGHGPVDHFYKTR